ncbi:beta-galactosidase (plasmid) [Rathayibacter sp. VKM Ac-2803]|uniref:Beta-galactosidase n=1 Tax=Rathayibacter caricis DSM 15933 TaxID=1328867 RepID=A0A2T4UPC0_9MICO|nr:beta-galactosidase [Rathayibacter sp. VKM Ac-2803]PTL71373.1 beta-galactosidase [Rathayibacter caricis DSM 15933]
MVSHSLDLPTGTTFPGIADGFAFGGDYSPEQWPESVWVDDVRLMREAGVNCVNLGVFSWGLVETADGVFDFGWLDRVFDLLHENEVGINLATPTAAPPVWLLQKHPEILRTDASGVRMSQGGRLGWSPSSAVFRRYALRIVEALARRYGAHPALRLWHVSNELGNENHRCFSDETARAWQLWLSRRFESIGALNRAWGTAFWGHVYSDFDEILPPRTTGTSHNPGLLLDFERFSSDALLEHYRAERDLLRSLAPAIPITTNFMIQNEPGVANYSRWAQDVDLVANDHYPIAADPEGHGELSFSADRTRGVAGGRPWLLIEHSTSAVNWQPRNRAKAPGELARNSLAHIARGADGALFFQWRQSTAGSEQFHSAMVPHAGADSRIFREVAALGASLERLAEVAGSVTERADIAILFSEDAAAALRSGPKPSIELTPLEEALSYHRVLTARGLAVDVLPPEADLEAYRLVLLPSVYLLPAAAVERLTRWVEAGGVLVVSPFSGIVDDEGRVIGGGYPGALRDLLGVRMEEFFPLLERQKTVLSDGSAGHLWSELGRSAGAEVTATYRTGALAGSPALFRRSVGSGTAIYHSTFLDTDSKDALIASLARRHHLRPVAEGDPGLERVRRVSSDSSAPSSWLFAINHTLEPRSLHVTGVDLMTGMTADGAAVIAPGDVAVFRETERRR